MARPDGQEIIFYSSGMNAATGSNHRWQNMEGAKLTVCTMCNQCCDDQKCMWSGIMGDKFRECRCKTTVGGCTDCGICRRCAEELWEIRSVLRPCAYCPPKMKSLALDPVHNNTVHVTNYNRGVNYIWLESNKSFLQVAPGPGVICTTKEERKKEEKAKRGSRRNSPVVYVNTMADTFTFKIKEMDIREAVQFLHNLGTVQYFDNDFLRSRVVINPQWIVNVMACLVSVKNTAIQNGVFKHKDIPEVWSDYDASLHSWLLQLTEEFDLTFPLPKEMTNIVPCLLPQKEPEFNWPSVEGRDGIRQTKMVYRFAYLPAGLFNRAQVRLFQFSDGKAIWKRGSLLWKNNRLAIIRQTRHDQPSPMAGVWRQYRLLFFIANVVSAALYISGFMEAIVENFEPGGSMIGEGAQGIPGVTVWWTYNLYAFIVAFVCLFVCIIGRAMFARTSVFILMLLTNPPLLFCDEPTSGLDSYMAQNIIQTLRNMSDKGRTILCTIHQPSSEVYAMFDQILYISEGRIAYMGSSEGVFPFFGSVGYNCPNNFNPADYFVHTLAIIPGEDQKCRERSEGICDAFEMSKESGLIQSVTEEIIARSGDNVVQSISEDIVSSRRYEVSWFVQFYILLWRSWVFNIREPQVLGVRAMQSMVMAIILGLVFLQVEINQAGIQNINGVIFLMLMIVSMTNMFSAVHVFPLWQPLLFREYGSGLYRIDIYYTTKTLSDVPLFVTFALLFSVIIYWMVGLNPDAEIFLTCIGMCVLIASVAISFGYMLSTLSNSVAMATAIGPPLFMPLMIFGGFFLNIGSVPDYFIWLQYISWFKYANEILVINQWSNIKNITCESLKPLVNGTGPPSIPCFTTGKQVIKALNFDEDNFNLDIGLLCALMFVFSTLGLVILMIKAKRSRR